MLEVPQYDSARPELQALHLNENSRSILEKSGKKSQKESKKTQKRKKAEK